MNDLKDNHESDKISKKDAGIELFKLGFPFLIILLAYIFFVA